MMSGLILPLPMIRDSVEWCFMGCCLRGREYTVSDDVNMPLIRICFLQLLAGNWVMRPKEI